jgi:hypothetical protein
MRQRELFEPPQSSKILVPETIVTELIALLAQLMLSTLNAAEEERSDEPD